MGLLGRRPSADDVLDGVDLRGRVVLVTGADSGIGFETARALAAHGARVWLGCLAREGGDAAAARIAAAHPRADVRPLPFDLGDLEAVEAAARALPEAELHALVCNAGVYGGPYATTVNGFERTLGVCYVGHAALALALLDRLEAGARALGAPSRVVMVSSENHRFPPTLDLDALPTPRARYTELRAYGQAKLCCVMFALALDARHASRGVRGYALHPGDLVSTGIDRDSGFLRTVMWLARPFAPTASQAAATSVWVATAPELAERGGRYFSDVREKAPSAGALDVEKRDRLWELTLRWIRDRSPSPPPVI